jgi:hypothetical protein
VVVTLRLAQKRRDFATPDADFVWAGEDGTAARAGRKVKKSAAIAKDLSLIGCFASRGGKISVSILNRPADPARPKLHVQA